MQKKVQRRIIIKKKSSNFSLSNLGIKKKQSIEDDAYSFLSVHSQLPDRVPKKNDFIPKKIIQIKKNNFNVLFKNKCGFDGDFSAALNHNISNTSKAILNTGKPNFNADQWRNNIYNCKSSSEHDDSTESLTSNDYLTSVNTNNLYDSHIKQHTSNNCSIPDKKNNSLCLNELLKPEPVVQSSLKDLYNFTDIQTPRHTMIMNSTTHLSSPRLNQERRTLCSPRKKSIPEFIRLKSIQRIKKLIRDSNKKIPCTISPTQSALESSPTQNIPFENIDKHIFNPLKIHNLQNHYENHQSTGECAGTKPEFYSNVNSTNNQFTHYAIEKSINTRARNNSKDKNIFKQFENKFITNCKCPNTHQSLYVQNTNDSFLSTNLNYRDFDTNFSHSHSKYDIPNYIVNVTYEDMDNIVGQLTWMDIYTFPYNM